MTTCSAPCDPPCEGRAVSGGLCAGHLARKRRGKPIDSPLAARDGSDAMGETIVAKVPEELRAAVEAKGKALGLKKLGESVRAALEAWVAEPVKSKGKNKAGG